MSALSLSISAQKKPVPATKGSQQEPGKPLLLGAPPIAPPKDSGDSSVPPSADSSQPGAPSIADSNQPGAPSIPESSLPGAPSIAESSLPGATPPEASSNLGIALTDSTHAREETSEIGAASAEVSDQPKPGAPSSADLSDPGSSTHVDSLLNPWISVSLLLYSQLILINLKLHNLQPTQLNLPWISGLLSNN